MLRNLNVQILLTSFDVISFDVFDTLLLRPYVKPTDLFFRIELDAGVKGFAEDRVAGERRAHAKARRAGRVEATFDEIYEEIPQWAEMKEKELAEEKKCLTANPEMVDIFNAAKSMGKKVVIASDMYLPKSFLQDILQDKGIEGWDRFYLSNECQLQKLNGGIYEAMLRDYGVPADRILHIGDNRTSDVEMPNSHGIVAFGYQKVIDKFFEECPFARYFMEDHSDVTKRFFVGVLALGWHLYKHEHRDWTYWNRIGFLFAGTLGYAYMRFVGESAIKRGIDHLMFVARDGYVLKKVFNILYPNIRTDYFYASRISALFATQYFGEKERDVVKRRKYCLDYLRKYHDVQMTGNEESVFYETGRLPETVQGVLNAISANARRESEMYFSQFKFDPEHSALVDGTSGNLTVQRFLSAIYGHDVFTYYLLTMLPIGNGETLYYSPLSDARYLGFSEFLFGAPTPPLDKIENGKPVFKEGVKFYEKFKIAVSDEISEGAVACAKLLDAHKIEVPHLMWLDWNDSFMDNQTIEDKEMMSFACDSVAPGHEGSYFNVIKPPHGVRRKKLFGKTLLSLTIKRFGETYLYVVYLFGRYELMRVKNCWWSRWRALFST